MKKMNLINLVLLSVLILVSCEFTTSSSDKKKICEKTYTPADKAELIDNIDTLYNQCGGNKANYNNIDVSAITDMSELFQGNTEFNGDISDWDTSSVTNMTSMFNEASSFNQPIWKWDTSLVKDMSSMFGSAEMFNQPIEEWVTSSVENMKNMFYYAASFNQPLDDWDTGNVTNMNQMFFIAINFNQNLKDWSNFAKPDTFRMFDGSGMSETNKAYWMPK